MRFYAINSGSVSVNDCHFLRLLKAWRNALLCAAGCVAFWWYDSRISLMEIPSKEEQIIEAAKQANAWEFIKEFEGLETSG